MADVIQFVINPKAGTKDKSFFQDRLHSVLNQDKYQPQIIYTEYQGHAQEISRQAAAKGIPFVVAVGGDGTVNECASSLIKTESSLGIIPLGSGNGLARDLHIPLEIEQALELLNNCSIQCIDCGQTNDGYFFTTAGVGFDAYISERFAHSSQRGLIGYMRKVVEEFLVYENQEYLIKTLEAERKYKAFSITFANAAQFGNNAFISPHADIKDGKLDMCIVKDYPKHLGLSLGLRLFNRSIDKSRYVEITRLTQAIVECPANSYYHRDGEVKKLKGTRFEIEVLPQALKVMVPPTDN